MNFTSVALIIKLQSVRWGGVEAFNDFAGSLSQLEELKQEERMREAITESKSLLSGNQIGRNSSGNLRIYGSLDDRIVKTLLWQK